MTSSVSSIAQSVRAALATPDLAGFADLLAPGVTWGLAGDTSPACRNRPQVLAWYSRAVASGRDVEVRDVTVHGDRVLVAVTVTTPEDEGETVEDRWQVLTVEGGLVTDIRVYDDEAAAREAAGPVTPGAL